MSLLSLLRMSLTIKETNRETDKQNKPSIDVMLDNGELKNAQEIVMSNSEIKEDYSLLGTRPKVKPPPKPPKLKSLPKSTEFDETIRRNSRLKTCRNANKESCQNDKKNQKIKVKLSWMIRRIKSLIRLG